MASLDTFERVFALIDPKQFERAFRSWVGRLIPALGQDQVVAIDGKSCRRTTSKATAAPLHLVSAFAANVGVVLGQTATAEKSNEITAIPELLKVLDINGCIVTIDAMGTQTKIARTIREQGAHYVLSVKDNHPNLCDSIIFANIHPSGPITPVSTHESTSTGHGRIEVRRCTAFDASDRLYKTDAWKDVASFAVVERVRTMGGRTSTERAYYISSLPADVERIALVIKSHWEVESVPQAHSKEVQHEPTNCVEAAWKMRVGPSESAFRSGLQTTPSCCGQEPSVVSVGVKASGPYPEQVRIRETNESDPSMTRRYPKNCRQNQGRFYLLGQACRTPDYWAGVRVNGARYAFYRPVSRIPLVQNELPLTAWNVASRHRSETYALKAPVADVVHGASTSGVAPPISAYITGSIEPVVATVGSRNV